MNLNYFKYCLFLSVLPLISFGQKKDLTNWNLNGKVKSIKESSFFAIEKNGEFIKDSLEFYYINKFNVYGNKIEDKRFSSKGNLEKKYVYKFDKENRRIEESQYNGEEKLM
ncbi:MAG: hypothetical protein GW876_14130, partial [Bacteroidetes bacterium]|nr:hypothetical protein [Bacteroidota bacterium]